VCECVCAMMASETSYSYNNERTYPLPAFTHEEAHTTNPHNGHTINFLSFDKRLLLPFCKWPRTHQTEQEFRERRRAEHKDNQLLIGGSASAPDQIRPKL